MALVLTTLLVVLDKAGKLKGPALFVLLGVAALMAVPLALSNSWVTGAPSTMTRFGRGALLISAIGVVYSLIAIWIAPDSIAVFQREATTEAAPASPAPPGLTALGYDTLYPAMTEIGGIVWSSKFYELHLIINNSTDFDYTNIDLNVEPDAAIARMGEVGGYCELILGGGNVQADIHMEAVQPNGQRLGNPLVLIAYQGLHRIRCDKLPRRSRIDVVMAAVTVDMDRLKLIHDNRGVLGDAYVMRLDLPPHMIGWYAHKMSAPKTNFLFGSKPVVTQVRVDGIYSLGDKPGTISEVLKIQDVIKDGFKNIPIRPQQ